MSSGGKLTFSLTVPVTSDYSLEYKTIIEDPYDYVLVHFESPVSVYSKNDYVVMPALQAALIFNEEMRDAAESAISNSITAAALLMGAGEVAVGYEAYLAGRSAIAAYRLGKASLDLSAGIAEIYIDQDLAEGWTTSPSGIERLEKWKKILQAYAIGSLAAEIPTVLSKYGLGAKWSLGQEESKMDNAMDELLGIIDSDYYNFLHNRYKSLNSSFLSDFRGLDDAAKDAFKLDFPKNSTIILDKFASGEVGVRAWKDWFNFPNFRKNTDLLENYYPKRKKVLLDVEETLGGHSIARHGPHLSLSEMQQRVLGTHPTLGQSRSALRFDNATLHKDAVDQAFNSKKVDIETHFDSGNTTNFEVDYDFGSQVGAGYTNTGTLSNPTAVSVTSTKVKLIFKADPSNPTGYKLLTAYPSYP